MYFCEVSCRVSSPSSPPQFKLPEITRGLCYRPWKWCFHVMKLRMSAARPLVMMDVSEGRRPRYDCFLELCRLGEVKSGAVLTIAMCALPLNMAWGTIYTWIVLKHFPKGFCDQQSQDTVLDGLLAWVSMTLLLLCSDTLLLQFRKQKETFWPAFWIFWLSIVIFNFCYLHPYKPFQTVLWDTGIPLLLFYLPWVKANFKVTG